MLQVVVVGVLLSLVHHHLELDYLEVLVEVLMFVQP